jgi:ATP-binding cassette subfamily B protein
VAVLVREVRPPESRSSINQLIGIGALLKPHHKALLIGLLAALGEAAANLAEPYPLKIVLDYVLRNHPIKGWMQRFLFSLAGENKLMVLEIAAAAVLVIALMGALSSYTQKSHINTVGQWVAHDLRRTLYSHIQKLSLAYHDQKRTGDLVSRVTVDINAVQSFIASGLLGILIDCLTIAGIIAVMALTNWRFTLVSLSVVPVLFLVIYTYTRRIKQASREVRKKEGEIASVVSEVLSSIRVVKAFAREGYELRRLEEQSLENVEMALRARTLKAKLMPMVELIVALGTCLVLWFGVRMVLNGSLSTGSLVMFIFYLKNIYKPIQDMSKMTDTYSKAAVGYERIHEVLEDTHEVNDFPGARPAPFFRGSIRFEHVTFGYTANHPVLRDVDLEVAPGQVAALVGPTGAGKTTIISLIPRFYDPDSGAVRIDGRDIRRFTQQSVRQQISFVLQETLLFHAPVWENIAYGKPEASRAEIMRASQLANAHEFVEKLPDGYDTVVGERGVMLSGGQRQRIAIARAIIRDTPILILDEPSSGLDAASERLVFEALDRLMEGKTTIVIAHRLSTVRRADVIFVVKDGTIIERGRHDDLLNLNGLYAEHYNLQFMKPEDVEEVPDARSWIKG